MLFVNHNFSHEMYIILFLPYLQLQQILKIHFLSATRLYAYDFSSNSWEISIPYIIYRIITVKKYPSNSTCAPNTNKVKKAFLVLPSCIHFCPGKPLPDVKIVDEHANELTKHLLDYQQYKSHEFIFLDFKLNTVFKYK